MSLFELFEVGRGRRQQAETVRFRVVRAAEKRRFEPRKQEVKPKNGKMLELFIVDNERETTFFKKIFENGLAFFENMGYNNISFWSTSGSSRRFGLRDRSRYE